MEYDKSLLDAYVKNFLLDRENLAEKMESHCGTSRLFEKIPMVMKAIAAEGYFMSIHLSGLEMKIAITSYLNSEFPDSIDPEIPASVEYAKQYWMMVYGY
jgi:hypothetical protein